MAPGRKRILNAFDSSSDDAASPQQPATKRKPEPLTVKEKEMQLITLKKMEPDFDTMVTASLFCLPKKINLLKI